MWLFLLVVFGLNGLAYEHPPVTSQAKCEGLDASIRTAWITGQHSVNGLGEIKGFRTFCTPLPEGLDVERFSRRQLVPRPTTVHQPTVVSVEPPSDGGFRDVFPLSQHADSR